MKIREAFTVLQVSEHATESDVKKAYRQLVKQVHPDVNVNENAHVEFQRLQTAYELVQLYMQYIHAKQDYASRNAAVTYSRSKAYRAQKFAQRDVFYAKLQYDIALFSASYKFFISKTLAIFSFAIACLMLVDYLFPSLIHYEPVQGVYQEKSFMSSSTSGNSDYSLFVQDRVVRIAQAHALSLQQVEYVLVNETPLFHQILSVEYTSDSIDKNVEIYNFYNDAFFFLVFLLLLGMCVFFIQSHVLLYYTILRYYNLYILPLILVFILLGEARVFRLFGVV